MSCSVPALLLQEAEDPSTFCPETCWTGIVDAAGPAAEASPEIVIVATSVALNDTVRARDTVMVLLLVQKS